MIMEMIDNFIDKLTMYRLTLYVLLFIWLAAFSLSFFKILPYTPFDMAMSALFILAVCIFSNLIFAWTFKVPTNIESVYITALILALIIIPAKPLDNLWFLGWAAVWAMASKYIFAPGNKHIFNPAAFAVALTAIAINQSASWWVGNIYMVPFVLSGGLMLVRKIKRFDMVISFFCVSLAATTAFALIGEKDILNSLTMAVFYSPMLFFALVMLTEPMTSPPTKAMRVIYGALVGFLFTPDVHIGSIYFSPELALLAGNIFAYAVSPKYKLTLKLKKKVEAALGAYDFIFKSDQKLAFVPGQYMEWTLDHPDQDDRGIRRFLTLASSPTESDVMMGVKFYPDPSSFKRSLINMKEGGEIIASQLAGDFVMPKNKKQKLVFIAGGIGITPFRSMIKYLLDIRERRSIVLFYSNKIFSDILYKEAFDEAKRQLGIKTIYALTDPDNIPPDWQGYVGHVSEETIKKEVPDYMERIFYLSGPHSMVVDFEEVLKKMGVARRRIKIDYFPGFA